MLSLDMDGNDYWILNSLLDCVQPPVVVFEFNPHCGPDRSLTIPYQPDFRLDFSVQPYRCGASLPASSSSENARATASSVFSRLDSMHSSFAMGLASTAHRSARDCFERNERLQAWSQAWLTPCSPAIRHGKRCE